MTSAETPTILRTERQGYRKVFSSNHTSAAGAAITAQTSAPSGDGVFVVIGNSIEVVPFGTDAEGETFDLRIVRWKDVAGQWVPTAGVEVTCTLGAFGGGGAGSSGQPLTGSDFLCKGISFSDWDDSVQIVEDSAASANAVLYMDVRGANRVEVIVSALTSAASANALVAAY